MASLFEPKARTVNPNVVLVRTKDSTRVITISSTIERGKGPHFEVPNVRMALTSEK